MVTILKSHLGKGYTICCDMLLSVTQQLVNSLPERNGLKRMKITRLTTAAETLCGEIETCDSYICSQSNLSN